MEPYFPHCVLVSISSVIVRLAPGLEEPAAPRPGEMRATLGRRNADRAHAAKCPLSGRGLQR